MEASLAGQGVLLPVVFLFLAAAVVAAFLARGGGRGAAVGIIDGVLYGFRLILYVLGVLVLGLVPALLGIGMFTRGEPAMGILLFLGGGMVTYTGSLGMIYKVIADAVHAGNAAASGE